MRRPRVKFTVRRLMSAVAVVALGFGGIHLWALRQTYLKKAVGYASFRALVLATPDTIAYWESRWTDQRKGWPARYPWPAGPPFVPAMARYYDAMRIKYERAARSPWLSVEPDPLPQ